MSKFTIQDLEKMALPSHYDKKHRKPIFKGKGNHNVEQLTDMAERYEEEIHRMRLMLSEALEIINSVTYIVGKETVENLKVLKGHNYSKLIKERG